MAKSKSSSKSKVKLTNKFNNKHTKSKRKQKSNKTFVPQNKVNATSLKQVGKKEQVGKREKTPVIHNAVEEDIDEDELAFSDEEMLQYVNENAQNLSLLSHDFSNNGNNNDKKKKPKERDETYENIPRCFSNDDQHDTKVELLPFKGDKGLIQRSRDVVQLLPPSDEGKDYVEDMPIVPPPDRKTAPVLSMVEILANHHADVNEKKMKIAHLSQEIIENTDKVGSLKELISLCNRDQPMAIQKLSLLSLAEVFKDIIPSYRIRELTEQERVIKVSRDVCALREFENSLLTNYQKYLAVLEENLKNCLKRLKRCRTNGISNTRKDSLKPMVSIATLSAQCLCELLKAAPHFNFKSNIITVVVPAIEFSGDLNEIGMICFNGVKSVLLADKVGDVSLEVIKTVNKLVKSKIHVKALVLEVLLFLQVNSDAIRSAEEKGNKMERLKKKREAINKMSRKEKKYKKVEDQLNKEMQEAEAVENKDRVERLHTEILNFLFVIYFRVLKADHVTALLPAVLQGLAKFSHLINVEFFQDLMIAMEKILKTEDIRLNESLNCIRTAVKITSGQGEVLTIDPKQFYTELYSRLLFVAADGVDGEISMAKSCIEDLILKRRKQVSMATVMGFFKRVASVLLQLKAEDAVEYAMIVRNIVQVHKKCDHLLDNDTCSRGVFQPDVADPEYCNAESSTLWELVLLCAHYHPNLNAISKHVMAAAPSQGTGALSSKFITRNSKKQKDIEGTEKYFPDFVPEKATSKGSYNTNVNTWRNKDLETMCVQQVCQHQQSTDYIDVNFDKLFPTAKRKKCNSD